MSTDLNTGGFSYLPMLEVKGYVGIKSKVAYFKVNG